MRTVDALAEGEDGFEVFEGVDDEIEGFEASVGGGVHEVDHFDAGNDGESAAEFYPSERVAFSEGIHPDVVKLVGQYHSSQILYAVEG